MIATLDRLQGLIQKLEQVKIDEHDRGLLFVSGNQKALLIRFAKEYLDEAEEILMYEDEILTKDV